MVNLTFVSESGTLLTLEANPNSVLNTLSTAIQRSFSIPPNLQQMRLDGEILDTSKTVSAVGLKDGDVVLVMPKQSANPPLPSSTSHRIPPPAYMLSALRADRELMTRIREQNPAFHDRIMNGDESVLSELTAMMRTPVSGASSSIAASGLDPMSADAQRVIEEEIRAANVKENMEAAFEHNPESFGSVVMLFVDCKINGVPGKAFVDSGAQATILSKECAERCNILRLMDTRFSGIARGVGTAKILGRIHLALLTLGSDVFEVTFTVMDKVGGGYDMLLGLDMLRKHQANIDLKHSCLRIGNVSVPFLAEKDIPSAMLGEGQPGRSASSIEIPQSGGSSRRNESRPTSTPNANAQDLSKLVELGFSRSEAIEALNACNGDADQAAAMLAATKYGF